MTSDLLLWLDLETTGSDEAHDSIIEIGAVLTTEYLMPLDEFSTIVTPEAEGLGRLMQNPIVRAMHEKNGLLAEILAAEHEVRPHHAAAALLGWARENGAVEKRVVLAGSGVGHFDRRFIARWMPQVDKFLRYWCIDVGVIRRAHELWTETPPPVPAGTGKTHRALDDARHHLAEAQAFRALWTAS